MDEIARQKLLGAIEEENLSQARDVIHCLRSIPTTSVKLKEIVCELIDHCLCKKFKITKLLIQEVLRLADGKVLGLEFLNRAIVKGDVEAAEELIYLGIDVHDQSYCFLHTAIESKRLEIAELLLAKGWNVNSIFVKCQTTPLRRAIRINYTQGVEFLLNHGAQLAVISGCNVLHFAASYGSLDCLKIFMNLGVYNINETSSCGTPIEIAAKFNHVNCVSYLSNHTDVDLRFKIHALHIALSAGGEACGLEIINSGVDISTHIINNISSIHAAALGNCVNVIKLLLERGVDVDLSARDNRQPLHFAVSSGHLESAELLLNRGAAIDKNVGQDCEPMIHTAMKTGNVKLVELLIQRGANVNSTYRGNSALHVAIKSHQLECAVSLVNHGAIVNVFNSKFKTPLYKAVKKCTFNVIEHLIRNGADVRYVNGPDQETPLHVACEKGFLKTVKLLIDHGADVNALSKSFKTPLSKAITENQEDVILLLLDRRADISRIIGSKPLINFAAERGYFDIVKRCLDSGANASFKNYQGVSTIHLAVENGNYGIVKLLLDWGEIVDSAIKVSAMTPLQMAAAKGHHRIVKLLVDRGASVNYQNNQEWAAIHYAAKKGCLESVKYLLLNGSKVNFSSPADPKTSPLFIAAGGNIDVCLAIIDYNPNFETGEYSFFDHLHYFTYKSLANSLGKAFNFNFDYQKVDWELFDQFVVKVIVKLQCQKKHIWQKCKTYISGSLELSKVQKDCERELSRMKTMFIEGFKFSLFEFFMENHNRSVSLLGNNAVVEAFKKTNFTKKFPLYADLIVRHFQSSLERKEFLDEGKRYLQTFSPELAITVIDKVFAYLEDKDICRLIAAFNPER